MERSAPLVFLARGNLSMVLLIVPPAYPENSLQNSTLHRRVYVHCALQTPVLSLALMRLQTVRATMALLGQTVATVQHVRLVSTKM